MNSQPDDLLVTLLDGIEEASERNQKMTLTVTTHGLVISGMAIGATEFFRRFEVIYRSGRPRSEREPRGDLASLATGELGRLAEDHRLSEELDALNAAGQLTEERRQQFIQDFERLTRRYVHMRDVIIWGAGLTPMELELWRGRLTELTGWSLGARRLAEGSEATPSIDNPDES